MVGTESARAQERPAPQDPRALASQSLQAGEVEAAAQVLRDWCGRRPTQPEPWEQAARVFLPFGQYAAAEEFAAEHARLLPRDPNAAVLLGSCILLAGDIPRAESYHREQAARFPRNAELHYGLGMSLARNQKLLEAERAFAQAIRHDPSNGSYRFWAGDNLLRLNRLQSAERHLRKAMTATPPVADATWKLALCLRHQGRADDADPLFLGAIESDAGRSSLRARYHYGVSLDERGRLDEARAQLEAVVKEWPEHRAAWHALARVQRKRGDEDAARAALQNYRRLRAVEDEMETQHLVDQVLGRTRR